MKIPLILTIIWLLLLIINKFRNPYKYDTSTKMAKHDALSKEGETD